ncbi:MAG: hypothetical protein Q8L85_00145 [Alphaproteobacteria bacterium]|nr:hypothetical protein [Alphaproteobacteria bacterium]
MKKTFFVLATALFLSYGASAMKVAGTASCDTKWNALTKNDAGQAMSFAYTKDAKLKIMERPVGKYLGKVDWLKVCEDNKKLGH